MRYLLLLLCVLLGTTTGHSQQKAAQLGKTATVTNDDYQYLLGEDFLMWLSNNGSMSHNPQIDGSGFEWPQSSGKRLVFEEGLIIGARQFGTVKVGGSTYRYGWQAGNILADGRAANPSDPKHRVYRARRMDAAEYNRYSASVQAQLRKDFLEWPTDLGAPFYDANKDGRYTPDFDTWLAGSTQVDAPEIRGREVCWYVSNDLDYVRTTQLYGTMPMGLELQVYVWAGTGDAVSERTVYVRYTLINKGIGALEECYIGRWVDPDVGDAGNDLVGIDTSAAVMYAYNGEASDDIYGASPPAIGMVWLQTPVVTSPGSTARFGDETREGYRNLPLSAFAFYINSDPVYQDPDLGEVGGSTQMYNYLRGKLYDGSSYMDPVTGLPTRFPLAGDPGSKTGWIDGVLHEPDDRRMLSSCGPFTLAPGDTQHVVMATTVGTGPIAVRALQNVVANAKQIKQNYLTGTPIFALSDASCALHWPAPDNFSLRVDVESEAGYDLTAILRDPAGQEMQRTPLHDDGQHGDGLAGDGRYGGEMSHAAYTTGADLVVALLGNNEIRAEAVVEQMLPVVGEIHLVDLAVVSDHLDFNREAAPGENVLYAFDIENNSSVALGPWMLTTEPPGVRSVTVDFAESIVRGTKGKVDGLNAEFSKLLAADIPPDVQPGSTVRIPVTLRCDQYCQWQDTLAIPVHWQSRPSYTGELIHTAGIAAGTLSYVVSDPSALNGHVLELVVNGLDDEEKTLRVRDVTAGKILYSALPMPDKYGHFSPEIGGLRLSIGSAYADVVVDRYGMRIGALRPVLWNFEQEDRAWFKAYGNYMEYGENFIGSSLSAFDYEPVMLVFDRVKTQKAYAYLHGTSPNYRYQGYYDIPVRAYNMSDPFNPRQVDLAFVEMSGSSAHDNRWFPTTNPGDREYLLVLDSPYSEYPNAEYTGSLYDDAWDMPILYGLWPVLNSSSLAFEDGDELWIRPQLPITNRDEYLLDGKLVTGVAAAEPVPGAVTLHSNYPNPFHGATTIAFTLSRATTVTLVVTDALGREVRRLVDGSAFQTGTHARSFDAAGLPPGVYYCRLMSGNTVQTQKMLRMR